MGFWGTVYGPRSICERILLRRTFGGPRSVIAEFHFYFIV